MLNLHGDAHFAQVHERFMQAGTAKDKMALRAIELLKSGMNGEEVVRKLRNEFHCSDGAAVAAIGSAREWMSFFGS
jgi:hypothetical protein